MTGQVGRLHEPVGGVLAAALAVALAVSAASTARAAASPDAHDRALAATLIAKAKTFQKLGGATSQGASSSLEHCPAFKKDPQKALSAFFLLIPVFLAEVVHDYGPQISDLRDSLDGMHPDSPLFRSWLTAESGSLSLLLQFDNHGKKVDLCEAANVLLAKTPSDADVYRVTGLHLATIGRLFSSKASASLQKLNPQMQKFFVAAGLSAADAKTLTSS